MTARNQIRWIALVVVLVSALAGCSAKPATGTSESGEVWLTTATAPGHNPFMPPAAAALPEKTATPPKLTPQGNGQSITPQSQPGNQEGLYGGTMNNSSCDRDKMIAFLQTHPAQAKAFVEALNADSTLFWSGGRQLRVDQIAAYLRELTPVILRVDTRVTNHGFDGTKATPLQSVLQAGTAVMVDGHGVPRARCYCGNPLTAPSALTATPKENGPRWAGYNPGTIVVVQPTTIVINIFVLIDIVTGQPFNRPVGSDGKKDAPKSGTAPGGAVKNGVYSSGGLSVTVKDAVLVKLAENIGGNCALNVDLSLAIDPTNGTFSGPWTSQVISGKCTGASGTMSGSVHDNVMTLTLVNNSTGKTFTDQLQLGSRR
ncbi:DUF6777 domain-containing protein [Smaragdicoccus niigatensis]|uniref:DUF6777 domain-containing protein n=1 Tax=Smaragdicoccus niigatensis TaxID=359359 RepID=UPI0003A95A64|nr:DUF6777 domain-containing protein [Smaragdicoccus niigatensis]